MPITLKKDVWKVKDPSSGQYRGAAILSTTLPQDAAQIISESNATIQNIKDTAIEAVDTALNDESTGLIPKAEADRDAIDDSLNNASNGIIPTAQSDRDDIDDSLNNIEDGIIPTAQANLATIAQAVQSQIGQGTDKTLSVAKGFADAKAAGMMVKVSNYQPGSQLDDPRTSQDASQNIGYPVYKDSNRVWVKETYAELEVPTMDDHNELNSALDGLDINEKFLNDLVTGHGVAITKDYFKNGHVTSDGQDAVSSSIVVTEAWLYLSCDAKMSIIANGMYYELVTYNDDGTATISSTYTGSRNFILLAGKRYRIQCRNPNSAAITPEDMAMDIVLSLKNTNLLNLDDSIISGVVRHENRIDLGEFESGVYTAAGVRAPSSKSIRTKDYVDVSKFRAIRFQASKAALYHTSPPYNTEITGSGYRFSVIWFDSDYNALTGHANHAQWNTADSTVDVGNASFVKICISNKDTSADINVSEAINLVVSFISDITDVLSGGVVDSEFYYNPYEAGALTAKGTPVDSSEAQSTRIRSKYYYEIPNNSYPVIEIDNGYRFSVYWFDGNFSPLIHLDNHGTWNNNNFGSTQTIEFYDLRGAKYFRTCVSKPTGNIDVSEATAIKVYYKQNLNTQLDALTPRDVITGYDRQEYELFKNVAQDIDANTFVFTLTADNHYEPGVYTGKDILRTTKAYVKLSEKIGADCMVNVGDMVMEYQGDVKVTYDRISDMMSVFGRSYLPFIYAVGHHEMYPYISSSNSYTGDLKKLTGLTQRFTRYMKDVHAVNDPASSSFYIDDYRTKIRMISINSVSDTTCGFSQNVVDWFENEAMANVPTGYAVMVFAHVAARKWLNWNLNDVMRGDLIDNILINYVQNGGTVLGYFHGHTHWDNVGISPESNYPVISTCCMRCHQFDISSGSRNDQVKGHPVNYPRENKSYSEYCFDVFCVHPDTKIVDAYRFGVGNNRRIHSQMIEVNGTEQLTASFKTACNTANTLTVSSWASDDTTVATVSSSGLVTAVASGETTIRAVMDNGDIEFWCVHV